MRVDAAYSDMMDRDGMLSLELRRVDEENIKISAFGMSGEINAEDAAEEWQAIQARVTDALDSAAGSVRTLLGLSDSTDENSRDLQQVVFPVQTL